MSASRRTAWIAWVAGAVPVVVAALFIGYTSIFSHYLWYDDEGYVMISVHGYLRGHPLFREVYTQYGPFFFFTRRAIYALLGVPVSHDANRLIALGEWLAAAGLCGVVAGRLTRSAWMGLLAGSLAFVHLEAFVKEPGHPQQLCMLLVATALVLGTLGRRSVGLVGIGVVCAALATTKVNIAAYLAPAIPLALLLAGARQRLGREALGLVAALVVGGDHDRHRPRVLPRRPGRPRSGRAHAAPRGPAPSRGRPAEPARRDDRARRHRKVAESGDYGRRARGRLAADGRGTRAVERSATGVAGAAGEISY